jgi:hypothetical protein
LAYCVLGICDWHLTIALKLLFLLNLCIKLYFTRLLFVYHNLCVEKYHICILYI